MLLRPRLDRAFALLALLVACDVHTVAAQSSSAAAAWQPADSVSVFLGLDGSKQPQDLGINANMGSRLSINWGVPVARRNGLGIQAGLGSNLSDAAVHVLDQISPTSRRTQTFLTLGLFQRATPKLSWALVYDHLWEQYYADVQLGQIRAEADVQVTPTVTIGGWATHGVKGADAALGDTAVHLDGITQVNGVFRRTWATRAETAIWVGVAAGHHNVVWVFPDNAQTGHVLVYGADLHIPLSDRVALMGAANLITPTATGTVDAYLGVAFYPGGHLLTTARPPWTPVASVANNTAFSVDLRR